MPRTPWVFIPYLWLLLAIVWLVGALRTKRVVRRQPIGGQLLQRVLTLSTWCLLGFPATGVGPLGWRFLTPGSGVAWTGVGLTAAGVALAIWARVILGGNWSFNVTVKESHELVLRGPYAVVRHPIYSGLSLAVLGTALVVGEVRGLVALVLVLTAWRLKWPVEERFMIEQFGDQYRAYMRRVRAIMPGLW